MPGIGADVKVLRAISISHVPDDPLSWESLRLSTDRLCLHPPTARDAEALYDLFADRQVMDGLGMTPVSALDEAGAMIEGWIDGWRTDGIGPFVFENPATHQVVGQAGLMVFDTRGWTPSNWAKAGRHAQPELGWALIRAHWGQGYATEAAAAIRAWAYESRSIDRLVSLITPGNARSQRVAQTARCDTRRDRHAGRFGTDCGRVAPSRRMNPVRRHDRRRDPAPWSGGEDRTYGLLPRLPGWLPQNDDRVRRPAHRQRA